MVAGIIKLKNKWLNKKKLETLLQAIQIYLQVKGHLHQLVGAVVINQQEVIMEAQELEVQHLNGGQLEVLSELVDLDHAAEDFITQEA